MDRSHRVGALLSIVAAATLFSTGGAAIKLSTLQPLQIVGLRSLVAAVTLLLLSREARGFRAELRRPATVLIGLSYAVTMLLYVVANRQTTAANVVFLQSTAPLYLLVLAPLVLKERVRRADVGVLAAIGVGLVLVVTGGGGQQATAPSPGLGNALAAAGGLTWALTLLGLRWRSRTSESGLPAVCAGNLIACAIALPFVFPLPAVGAADVLVLGWLGVFQIAIAYVFATRGLRHIPAFQASLVFVIEPVLNPVWAWLLHGETPGTKVMLGGAVILAAGLVGSRRGE